MEPSKKPQRRLLELDSLRGLAALSVLLYHYSFMYGKFYGRDQQPFFSWSRGNLGVYFFFIISGFVILMTVSRAKSILDFAVSRVSRIYPAYWVAVALTFTVMTIAGTWPERRIGGGAAIVNLTMLQQFVHVPNVDGVYWTLQYELVFYGLALALLMLGLVRRVEFVSAGLLILSLLYWAALRGDLFVHFGPAGALFKWGLILLLIFQNVQYFVTGMMLYRIWNDRFTPFRAAIVALSVATTLVVNGPFMACVNLLFVAIMALVVSGRLAFLRSSPLVYLGTISYTLYLVHQYIGYALIHSLEARGVNANIAIPTTVLAAIALASALSFGVEQPAMRLIRSRYGHFKAWRLNAARQPVVSPAD